MVLLIKGCTNMTVLLDASQLPEGCDSAVVSPTVTIHIPLQVGFWVLLVIQS